MRFHTPDDAVLQVDRVGGLHTYAARMGDGDWTAWGEVRTVVVAATGYAPPGPWVDRVIAYLQDGEALPDVPGAARERQAGRSGLSVPASPPEPTEA